MCVWVGVVGTVPCCHGCHGDAALAGTPEGYDWGYVAHDERGVKERGSSAGWKAVYARWRRL